ncbi:MAG: glycerol-3-phosphate 1-O-acyltransferase [Candidatus Latescibacterota bacterium]|nr:MAG: glycerol-3-phosphate 1-O-acyltransferase [Candidatus Latescibacterota bacterium]
MLLVAVLAGFLAGSIPFGYIVPKLARGIDIRTVGSGNPGFTNVYRALGPGLGTIVLAADVGKGVLAALAGRWLAGENAAILSGLAGIAGHVWPPFLGFRGGKGVAAAAGVFFTILPLEAAISLGVFLAAVLASRYVSLGSILAAATLPIAVFAFDRIRGGPARPLHLLLALTVAVLIIGRHRGNVRRLLAGTENRFSLRRRTGG